MAYLIPALMLAACSQPAAPPAEPAAGAAADGGQRGSDACR